MAASPTDYEAILAELKGKASGRNSSGPARTTTLPQTTVRNLLLAGLLTIALYFIPYAGFITYPLRLLVTFIHEGSHALMALVVGGAVSSVKIMPDGSGVTMAEAAPGLPSMLVSSAGYLGATLCGALVIGLLRRGIPGRALLLVTGALVGLVTLGVFLGLLSTNNFFGLGWGCFLTLALGVAGWKLSPKAAGWLAARTRRLTRTINAIRSVFPTIW